MVESERGLAEKVAREKGGRRENRERREREFGRGRGRRVGTEKQRFMFGQFAGLGPNADGGVPAGGADGSAVGTDAQTRDAILVAVKDQLANTLQGVPDAHPVVAIAGEQNAP